MHGCQKIERPNHVVHVIFQRLLAGLIYGAIGCEMQDRRWSAFSYHLIKPTPVKDVVPNKGPIGLPTRGRGVRLA